MIKVYTALAYVIAVEVVVQAAAIAFAMFGLGAWIEDGGVADKAAFADENLPDFTGAVGFTFHGENGGLYIPVIALAFLVVSFFVKDLPRARTWGGIVLGLVALQTTLGFLSLAVAGLGPLHGINAFVLFSAAVHAARRTGRSVVSATVDPGP